MTPPKDADDLGDILVEVIPSDMELGHDPDGLPKSLPKKRDGTPDIDHKEKPDPAAEARKLAESELGKQWQKERDEAIQQRDAERTARAETERKAQERLDAERKARETAEQERDERTGWAKNSHWEVLRERKEKFQTGLETVTAHIEDLKDRIAAASEAQEHRKVAELTSSMAEAMTAKATYDAANKRIDAQIEDTKARFEQGDERQEREPAKREEKREEKEAFDLDKWIASSPTVTQPWLKEHRGDLSNPKMLARVYAFAQSYALDKDDPNALDSAEFVTALNAKFYPKQEEAMTEKKDKDDEHEEEEAEAEKPERASHAAPVSRNSRPAQGSSAGNTIRLTQDQLNTAPNLYPSYDDLGPEAKKKFPAWSETAAAWQYDFDMKRAKAAGKYDR